MNCEYVFISLVYVLTGLLYGYTLWQYLEVVDNYARG